MADQSGEQKKLPVTPELSLNQRPPSTSAANRAGRVLSVERSEIRQLRMDVITLKRSCSNMLEKVLELEIALDNAMKIHEGANPLLANLADDI